MEAKCTHSSKQTNVIDTDLAACMFTVKGECPHGFPKIPGDVCDPVYRKPRACCLIQPTINVEVNYYALIIFPLPFPLL